MKKTFSLAMVLFLFIIQLTGCKQSESGADGSLQTQSSDNTITSEMGGVVDDNTIRTDEMGFGNVEYTVRNIHLGKSWSDFSINSEEVTESGRIIDSNSGIIVLEIEVKNVDVPEPNRESNINALLLVDAKEIENYDPNGPLQAIELSYFDNAPEGSLESGRTDYAHYMLPEKGLVKEVKIGFVVPIELIENNELSLMHTFMGFEEATILPLNLT